MSEIFILKTFLLKFRLQISIVFIVGLLINLFAYNKYINTNSTYILEYQVFNEQKEVPNLQDHIEKYNYLFNCDIYSYSPVCKGNYQLNNFLSCLNQNVCSNEYPVFNLSSHLKVLNEAIASKTNNTIDIKFADYHQIQINFFDISKDEEIEFNVILNESINYFNSYLNENLFLSFDNFSREIIDSLQSQLNLKNEYFINLQSKNENLKDYLQTIYNLDQLYIETFANDLENFRNNINDIEFKINDEVNFIIQSKPFFSFSKYLALFILIFFWGVIFFYCLKRNSLSKL